MEIKYMCKTCMVELWKYMNGTKVCPKCKKQNPEWIKVMDYTEVKK